MATDDKETKTPKNDGEKTLDEKNLDELEGEELLKAAKSFKGRFEHEKKKRTEYEKEIDESKKEKEEEEEPEPEPETDSGTTHAEDPYEFAKELNALKGLDERQIDAVKTIAKAKGVSPSKARQTDEAKKLINAYAEEKKKEEKTPEPSTKQSEPQEPPMDTGKLKNALKSGDKNAMDKFLKDAGFDKFSEAYKD